MQGAIATPGSAQRRGHHRKAASDTFAWAASALFEQLPPPPLPFPQQPPDAILGPEAAVATSGRDVGAGVAAAANGADTDGVQPLTSILPEDLVKFLQNVDEDDLDLDDVDVLDPDLDFDGDPDDLGGLPPTAVAAGRSGAGLGDGVSSGGADAMDLTSSGVGLGASALLGSSASLEEEAPGLAGAHDELGHHQQPGRAAGQRRKGASFSASAAGGGSRRGRHSRNPSDSQVGSPPSGPVPATGALPLDKPLSEFAGQTRANAFDPAQLDPKRARRIIANRQSAHRSRMKKLQLIHELEQQVEAARAATDAARQQAAAAAAARRHLMLEAAAAAARLAGLRREAAAAGALRAAVVAELAKRGIAAAPPPPAAVAGGQAAGDGSGSAAAVAAATAVLKPATTAAAAAVSSWSVHASCASTSTAVHTSPGVLSPATDGYCGGGGYVGGGSGGVGACGAPTSVTAAAAAVPGGPPDAAQGTGLGFGPSVRHSCERQLAGTVSPAAVPPGGGWAAGPTAPSQHPAQPLPPTLACSVGAHPAAAHGHTLDRPFSPALHPHPHMHPQLAPPLLHTSATGQGPHACPPPFLQGPSAASGPPQCLPAALAPSGDASMLAAAQPSQPLLRTLPVSTQQLQQQSQGCPGLPPPVAAGPLGAPPFHARTAQAHVAAHPCALPLPPLPLQQPHPYALLPLQPQPPGQPQDSHALLARHPSQQAQPLQPQRPQEPYPTGPPPLQAPCLLSDLRVRLPSGTGCADPTPGAVSAAAGGPLASGLGPPSAGYCGHGPLAPALPVGAGTGVGRAGTVEAAGAAVSCAAEGGSPMALDGAVFDGLMATAWLGAGGGGAAVFGGVTDVGDAEDVAEVFLLKEQPLPAVEGAGPAGAEARVGAAAGG